MSTDLGDLPLDEPMPDEVGWLVPAGTLVLWAGQLDAVPTGWLLADGRTLAVADYPALAAVLGTRFGGDGVTTFALPNTLGGFVRGVADANTHPGGTGGSSQHSHAGHAAHQVTQAADHAHSGGSVASAAAGIALSPHAGGSVGNGTTGISLSAHAGGVNANAPAGLAISAHSGAGVGDHGSHTHTYTEVPNHVHVQSVNSGTTGALSGYTPDTSTSTSVASGYSTQNPTGGVASGTTAAPGAALTHTVSQAANHILTEPNAGAGHSHPFGQPSAHVITDNGHGHTLSAPSNHSITDTGHGHSFTPPSAHSHSGAAVDGHSAHSTESTLPPFLELAFLIKA